MSNKIEILEKWTLGIDDHSKSRLTLGWASKIVEDLVSEGRLETWGKQGDMRFLITVQIQL